MGTKIGRVIAVAAAKVLINNYYDVVVEVLSEREVHIHKNPKRGAKKGSVVKSPLPQAELFELPAASGDTVTIKIDPDSYPHRPLEVKESVIK